MLAGGNLGDGGQLTPRGLAPGIVTQEIGDRGVAKSVLEGFLASIPHHCAKRGIQGYAHPSTVAPATTGKTENHQ